MDIINEDEIEMVIKSSINPWNVEKIIALGEKGYLKGPTISFRGRISIQKKGDFYHIVFNTDNNESYALVPSSILSKSNQLIDFNNQYVEISGYKRICNSKEFPIENSIGVMSIKVIE